MAMLYFALVTVRLITQRRMWNAYAISGEYHKIVNTNTKMLCNKTRLLENGAFEMLLLVTWQSYNCHYSLFINSFWICVFPARFKQRNLMIKKHCLDKPACANGLLKQDKPWCSTASLSQQLACPRFYLWIRSGPLYLTADVGWPLLLLRWEL